MSLASLISDMVRAGVDPDLIGRTAELIANSGQVNDAPSHRSSNAYRQARYRDRKRNETVTRNVTSVTVTPPPSLDKKDTPEPLEKINPTPGCAAGAPAYVHMHEASPSRQADQALEAELREAAGLQSDPSPNLMVLGTIRALMASGIPKATILQTISDKSRQRKAKGQGPPRSWDYFTEPIKQAHANALNAAKLPPPEAQNVKQSAKPENNFTAAIDRIRQRLELGSGDANQGFGAASFNVGSDGKAGFVGSLRSDQHPPATIIDGTCFEGRDDAYGPISEQSISGR